MKARTKRTERRAKKKATYQHQMDNPSGNSAYGQKQFIEKRLPKFSGICRELRNRPLIVGR
jgi:hypothetical protein